MSIKLDPYKHAFILEQKPAADKLVQILSEKCANYDSRKLRSALKAIDSLIYNKGRLVSVVNLNAVLESELSKGKDLMEIVTKTDSFLNLVIRRARRKEWTNEQYEDFAENFGLINVKYLIWRVENPEGKLDAKRNEGIKIKNF